MSVDMPADDGFGGIDGKGQIVLSNSRANEQALAYKRQNKSFHEQVLVDYFAD